MGHSLECQPYSGTDFLDNLDSKWGGHLFWGILPEHKPLVANIRPYAYDALMTMAMRTAEQVPALREIRLTKDPVSDFRKITIAGMPHPDEAQARMHMVADPFCRDYLHEQLEWFMQECLDPKPKEETLVANDEANLAFEGPDSFIFSTRLRLPSLESYINAAKARAEQLGKGIGLTSDELPSFTEELHKAIDRLSASVKMVQSGKAEDLHPIVKWTAEVVLAQFQML